MNYNGIAEYLNALVGFLKLYNLGIVVILNLNGMSWVSGIIADIVKDLELSLESENLPTMGMIAIVDKLIQVNVYYVQ